MQNYILVFCAVILLAVDFVLQKLYQKKQGTGMEAGLAFNAMLGFVTAVLFFFINGCRIEISLYAAAMAAGASICLLSYTILGFRVLKEGNISFYTMFLMAGGMIVPYVWGVLFLDESLSVLRVVGLIVMVAAIVLSNYSSARSSAKLLAFCVAIFFLNGGCSVFSKLCQVRSAYGVVKPTEFVFMTGSVRCILGSLAFCIVKHSKKEREAADAGGKGAFQKAIPIIVCSAVVSGTSYMLQLIGAANLPATVLYPIVSGGSIMFSMLAGMLVFKERPTACQICGVVLCLVGTCLFL